MAALHLSADEVDDILYLIRTNETAELLPYLSQLCQQHGTESPASILEACVDEYSGNTAFHFAAANGSTGELLLPPPPLPPHLGFSAVTSLRTQPQCGLVVASTKTLTRPPRATSRSPAISPQTLPRHTLFSSGEKSPLELQEPGGKLAPALGVAQRSHLDCRSPDNFGRRRLGQERGGESSRL